jgi:hypothetical protein
VESTTGKAFYGQIAEESITARAILRPFGLAFTNDLHTLILMGSVLVTGDMLDVVRTAGKVGLFVDDVETRGLLTDNTPHLPRFGQKTGEQQMHLQRNAGSAAKAASLGKLSQVMSPGVLSRFNMARSLRAQAIKVPAKAPGTAFSGPAARPKFRPPVAQKSASVLDRYGKLSSDNGDEKEDKKDNGNGGKKESIFDRMKKGKKSEKKADVNVGDQMRDIGWWLNDMTRDLNRKPEKGDKKGPFPSVGMGSLARKAVIAVTTNGTDGDELHQWEAKPTDKRTVTIRYSGKLKAQKR